MFRNLNVPLMLSAVLSIFVAGAYGKAKHPKAQGAAPEDEIKVVAHIRLTDGPVTQFLSTRHYRQDYLYAGHESNKRITLIDVTRLDHPAVLADMPYPSGGGENLVAATGNAALVSARESPSTPNSQATSTPQTFRIMSFADPAHPEVKQEFAGVTAMARDEKRGLIFLANAEGVWILQQHYAEDPEAEREWEHMALDAR